MTQTLGSITTTEEEEGEGKDGRNRKGEERGREGERQQALDVDSVLQNRTTGDRYSILYWWGGFVMATGTKLVSSFSSGFLLCPRTLPLVDLRVSVYVTASLGSYLGKTMPSEGKCLKILFTQKKRSCNINLENIMVSVESNGPERWCLS